MSCLSLSNHLITSSSELLRIPLNVKGRNHEILPVIPPVFEGKMVEKLQHNGKLDNRKHQLTKGGIFSHLQ